MLLLLASHVSLANTWWPHQDGFVTPSRQDAPPDAQIVYAANYRALATATNSAGDTLELESISLSTVGVEPRIAFLPPPSGWSEGETWVLSVQDYFEDVEAHSLTFTTGSAAAPAPPEVTVGEVEVSDWSEPATYAWGCCEPERLVTVDVSVPGADPWGWVELVGRFERGHRDMIFDLSMGPGEHQLSFYQWLDEEGLQPSCFDVVAVSAAGVRGSPQILCPEVGDTGTSEGGVPSGACGCRSTGGGVGVWGLLGLLGLGRYARRSSSSLR
jgi:MYXO-CTERM domain-containing protein